jgi:glutamate dehydrogenase
VHAQLTALVLASTSDDATAEDRVRQWEDQDLVMVSRARQTFQEICADEGADLARMSVALRVVRSLLATP